MLRIGQREKTNYSLTSSLDSLIPKQKNDLTNFVNAFYLC